MSFEWALISGESAFEKSSVLFFGKKYELTTGLDKSNQQNICTPETHYTLMPKTPAELKSP